MQFEFGQKNILAFKSCCLLHFLVTINLNCRTNKQRNTTKFEIFSDFGFATKYIIFNKKLTIKK